jgi:hypothetical protein
MRHSPRFLSIFEAAHLKFEGSGRTFFNPSEQQGVITGKMPFFEN